MYRLLFALLFIKSSALNYRRLHRKINTLLDTMVSIGQDEDLDSWVEKANQWRSEADNYIENIQKNEQKLLDFSTKELRQQTENQAEEILHHEQNDLDSFASARRAELDTHFADIDQGEETSIMQDIKKDEENLMNLAKTVNMVF